MNMLVKNPIVNFIIISFLSEVLVLCLFYTIAFAADSTNLDQCYLSLQVKETKDSTGIIRFSLIDIKPMKMNPGNLIPIYNKIDGSYEVDAVNSSDGVLSRYSIYSNRFTVVDGITSVDSDIIESDEGILDIGVPWSLNISNFIIKSDGKTTRIIPDGMVIPKCSDINIIANPRVKEVWNVGDTKTISWKSNNVDNVIIDLYSGGVLNKRLSYSRPASEGAFDWTVADDLDSSINYNIRIINADDGSVYSDSASITFKYKINDYVVKKPLGNDRGQPIASSSKSLNIPSKIVATSTTSFLKKFITEITDTVSNAFDTVTTFLGVQTPKTSNDSSISSTTTPLSSSSSRSSYIPPQSSVTNKSSPLATPISSPKASPTYTIKPPVSVSPVPLPVTTNSPLPTYKPPVYAPVSTYKPVISSSPSLSPSPLPSVTPSASVFSNQFRIDAVTQIFLTLLKRSPDAQGLNYWVNSSNSIDQIRSAIMNSQEYINLNKATSPVVIPTTTYYPTPTPSSIPTYSPIPTYPTSPVYSPTPTPSPIPVYSPNPSPILTSLPSPSPSPIYSPSPSLSPNPTVSTSPSPSSSPTSFNQSNYDFIATVLEIIRKIF